MLLLDSEQLLSFQSSDRLTTVAAERTLASVGEAFGELGIYAVNAVDDTTAMSVATPLSGDEDIGTDRTSDWMCVSDCCAFICRSGDKHLKGKHNILNAFVLSVLDIVPSLPVMVAVSWSFILGRTKEYHSLDVDHCIVPRLRLPGVSTWTSWSRHWPSQERLDECQTPLTAHQIMQIPSRLPNILAKVVPDRR